MINESIQSISYLNLGLAFIPVLAVVAILFNWALDYRNAVYALSRMLVQLMIVGYFLAYLFESNNAWIVLLVLAMMVFISSWIALQVIKPHRLKLYTLAVISISFGGGITLLLTTQVVLELQPWYSPRDLIPLAGMIFANAMNSVSLAAERFETELTRNIPYLEARNVAFNASLIPITNSLFAVGIISFPGMMTGQILSGVSPLIAARYQILVMCMIYASAGLSSACFLKYARFSKSKGSE